LGERRCSIEGGSYFDPASGSLDDTCPSGGLSAHDGGARSPIVLKHLEAGRLRTSKLNDIIPSLRDWDALIKPFVQATKTDK
jgi:hypothetical protein